MRCNNDQGTIKLSSNPDCPNCKEKTQHTVENWKKYHPLAGTGFSKEHGTPKPKE